MTNTPRLRPCPFCGSEHVRRHVRKIREGDSVTVECDECAARGPAWIGQAKFELAVSTWNDRPRTPPTVGELLGEYDEPKPKDD